MEGRVIAARRANVEVGDEILMSKGGLAKAAHITVFTMGLVNGLAVHAELSCRSRR